MEEKKNKKTRKPAELAPKPKRGLVSVGVDDERITEKNALFVEELYSASKILSEIVAALPLTLKRKTEKNKSKDAVEHPLYRLLKVAPNPYTTAYEFKQWLLIDYVLFNAGCAIITRDASGTITGLWQQHRTSITPLREKEDKFELFFDVNLDCGVSVKLHYKELFWCTNFFNDGVFGTSIIEGAQSSLQTARATDKYARDFFRRGISPDGFITWSDEIPDGAASDLAREELKKDLKAKYEGADKFHSALILPKGAQWTQVQFDLQKLQATESRNFNKKAIFSTLRLLPFMRGESDGGADSWRNQTKNILPILTAFEGALNLRLLSPEEQGEYYFKFNADALERGDFPARMSGYATALNNGIMTVNEVRAKEDLPPVEGGDELRQNSAIQDINHPKNAGGSNEYSEGKNG